MNTLKERILSWEHEELTEIANQGCASVCVGGFIYYTETCAAYDAHKEEIWDALSMQCEDIGYKNVLDMIANFRDANKISSDHEYKNALVWWYIEHIAHEYINTLEESNGKKKKAKKGNK